MVYAFLGLLNKPGLFAPLGSTVKPDYSAPLRSVYISLARTFIDGLKNLDLLSQVIGDEPVSLLIPFRPRFEYDLAFLFKNDLNIFWNNVNILCLATH